MTVHTPIDKIDPADAKVRRDLSELLHPRRSRRMAWIGALLVLIVGAWWLLRDGTPQAAAAPAPVLTVATPLAREINEWDDYVGRFEASQSVEVRPRVSGAVTASTSRDGADRPARASRSSPSIRARSRPRSPKRAPASRARSSDLALAQADLGRASRLVDDEAVSQSEVDRLQRPRPALPRRRSPAPQARVQRRALDVEFTQVRAPIGGRISDRRVDAGNLVSAGEGRRHAADHDQRARPDLLHLRRLGSAVPQDQARAAGRGDVGAGRDPAAGRGRLSAGGASSTSPTMASTRARARSAPARCSPIRACS